MTAVAVKTGKPLADWRRPMLMLAALLLLVGLGVALQRVVTDPHHFPVRVIEVRGEFRHLNRRRLEQEVAAEIGHGFVSTDMADIRNRIEGLAWVDSIELRRIWPDRLRMTVREQVPVARWGDDGLVNAQGGVFRPQPPVRPQQMPLLRASDAQAPKVVTLLNDVRPQLDAAGLSLASLALDGRGDWWLELRNGLLVVIGPQQPASRLQRFLRLYPALQMEAGREPVRVDLRYAHGAAVRWRVTDATVIESTTGGTPR